MDPCLEIFSDSQMEFHIQLKNSVSVKMLIVAYLHLFSILEKKLKIIDFTGTCSSFVPVQMILVPARLFAAELFIHTLFPT